MSKTRHKSVTEYIAAQPKPSQRVLRSVRSVIRRTLPDAEEVISYGMPAYRLHGYVALYFAAWRDHYSLYPVNDRLVGSLKPSSASYEVNDKGTIRFPLSEPVPEKLIAGIAKLKAEEAAERENAKLKKRLGRKR
jgi:uncharacterized protein YdhG (YjbR/CyaY superfamily)